MPGRHSGFFAKAASGTSKLDAAAALVQQAAGGAVGKDAAPDEEGKETAADDAPKTPPSAPSRLASYRQKTPEEVQADLEMKEARADAEARAGLSLLQHVRAAADDVAGPGRWRDLHSAAIHDAGMLAACGVGNALNLSIYDTMMKLNNLQYLQPLPPHEMSAVSTLHFTAPAASVKFAGCTSAP